MTFLRLLRRSFPALMLLLATSLPSAARAQLRIVEWNVSQSSNASSLASSLRPGTADVLQAIAADTRAGVSRPIDAFAIQESNGAQTTGQAYVSLLNSIYGAGTYSHSTLNGASTGSGTQTLIYNTKTVQLIAEAAVGTATTTGQARQELRYELRPVGYDSNADFYMYNGHWKAGSASSDTSRRSAETATVRANADSLAASLTTPLRALYVGDFNLQTSSETAYQNLVGVGSGGAGRAFDPLNRPGSWHNNAAFKDIMSQSPASTAAYSGQTTGGLDDRFDFQIATAPLVQTNSTGNGMTVLAGTYHTFGNTNNVALNNAINQTNDGAASFAAELGYTTTAAQTVLNELTQICDHLPTIVDYQLPAKMDVTLASPPPAVIVGANASLNLTVSNSAPVSLVSGADLLKYGYSGSGVVTGSGSGSDSALGGGDLHSLILNTSTVGNQTGSVNVTATSQQTANALFNQNISLTVLAHSNASFSGSSDINTLTYDFGTFNQDGTQTQSFTLANLASAFGSSLTARLDLDGINETGNTAQFSTDLTAFTNMVSATSSGFHVTFNTATAGDFSASFQLLLSDENLAGATNQTLTLNVVGHVRPVPEPASLAMLTLGLGMAVVQARRMRLSKVFR